MNNIFILDGQTDEVLGHINKKYVIDNEHEKDLPTHKDYFRFTVLADNKHAEHLNKRNGLIIPGEDGELLEFRIFESIKYRNNEGLFIEVHALATYLDLKTQKIFDPHKTNSETAVQHANLALAGTEWKVGQVDFKGIRTLTFDNPFNSYDYILRISREFELEPNFYIETDGNKVTGRYVDLVEQIGEFRGRTIEFGRDLQSIERKEDTSEVVTALWIYGPQREDGSRLKVFVEDDEARQRWGRRGQHIIDYYEPQTENQDITEERLETLGNMELKKRINAVVTYEAEILDLENIPGLENKKIRFGDTIRIKDTKFSPPLYVEARVFNQKRDVFNKSKKTVQLGDYREYTEEEAQAIWKLLQQQIQQKISALQAEQMIEEYAEPKKVESPTPPPIDSEGDNPIWIDTSKDPHVPHIVEQGQWVKVVPTEAEEVNAYNKSEIDTITSELEDGIQQAMTTADGKNTVFRQSSTPPTTDRKIGDLWFKTDEGNKMFVWTGSWTETKLDHQALSVGKLSAISADLGNVTAGDIRGVTMNLANGQFVVDENKVSIANDNVNIDEDGILVKSGNFRLVDDNTQLESVIRENSNLIQDHSFEMIPVRGNVDQYQTFAAAMNLVNYQYWWGVAGTNPNNARVLSTYQTDLPQMAKFGLQAAVLSNVNDYYWFQYIPVNPNQISDVYSISAFFTAYGRTSSTTLCEIVLQAYNSNMQWIDDVGRAQIEVKSNEKFVWKRASATIKNLPTNTRYIRIRLNTRGGYALADGVQMVPFDLPGVYEPEDALWHMLKGRYTADDINTRGLYVGEAAHLPNPVTFESGTSFDMSGGAVRIRQSPNNYFAQYSNGNFAIFADGQQRHVFSATGTKTGGTIIVDGKNLGMSPIDSPQILIEYIEFNVPLSKAGTKVYIDETYLKTIEEYAVFTNNGEIIEKGKDYIIVSGEGTADIRFVGERIGYKDTFFADMSVDKEEGTNEVDEEEKSD